MCAIENVLDVVVHVPGLNQKRLVQHTQYGPRLHQATKVELVATMRRLLIVG